MKYSIMNHNIIIQSDPNNRFNIILRKFKTKGVSQERSNLLAAVVSNSSIKWQQFKVHLFI